MKLFAVCCFLVLLALLIACSFWVSGEYVPDELTPEQIDSLEKANEGDSLEVLEAPQENGEPDGESYP